MLTKAESSNSVYIVILIYFLNHSKGIKMKAHEYLMVAGISAVTVYLLNHFMGNILVSRVVAASSPSGQVLA